MLKAARTSETSARVSPERLESMGKRAAETWRAGLHDNLSEAVVQAVKTAGLTREQVRRVVEFTNHEAFLREFQKEGAHRVVDFGDHGPADPAYVLQVLNNGAHGGHPVEHNVSDYNSPPTSSKEASAAEEDALRDMFGAPPPELPYAAPLGEADRLRVKLAGIRDHLTSQLTGLERAYADLSDQLHWHVKQAALNGVSLGEVMSAWEPIAPSEAHIKAAFELLAPRLLREGVFSSQEEMFGSLDKTASAGMVVNPTHPLIESFDAYCECLSKLAETRAERAEVITGLSQLTDFVKNADAVGAGRAVGGAAKAFGAARGLAERASGPAARAAEGLLGETAGQVVGGAVKYSPHLAAAVAANEARRHLMYSPTTRPVVDAVLQQVPMTPQYQQHNWDIATGQS